MSGLLYELTTIDIMKESSTIKRIPFCTTINTNSTP